MSTDKIQTLIEEFSQQELSASAQEFLRDVDSGNLNFQERHFSAVADPWSDAAPHFRFAYIAKGVAKEKVFEWSSKAEGELYKRHIKMDKVEAEAARGGTLLLSNLRITDLQYGKDYADSVLCVVVDERFSNIPAIQDTLKKIPTYKPSEGKSYTPCKEMLKHFIDGYGNSLVLELGYKNDEAFRILVGAVWYMLDRRHAITLGEILWKR